MPAAGSAVVVGGTSGIGLEVARALAGRGRDVVVAGRDAEQARTVAAALGGRAAGIAVDLTRPHDVAPALAAIGPVEQLVLAAIERDRNSVREYDVDRALRLVTLKLVGYTEVVHALAPRFVEGAAIVVFGGLAKDRPYPGSTTVSAVNGAVSGLVRTLAKELAPVRVNGLHPGIVGDSPAWAGRSRELDEIAARTPTGRLPTMADVVGAVLFLLENPAVNGAELTLDGGWLLG